MRIKDLPAPVTASKADWLPGTAWLGFTPSGNDIAARSQCQSTIQKQFGRGYIIEYATKGFEKPNAGFEKHPHYLMDREKHSNLAGRLISIHKLRTSARKLEVILGPDDFKRLQDMWAQRGKPYRWSVAFPIIESYDIVDRPLAKEVLGEAAYHRLYRQTSATLRVLNDDERALIANLELSEAKALNAWIGIEDEIKMAMDSQIDPRTQRLLDQDLAALEGILEERKISLKVRAAWQAGKFVRERQRLGKLTCDDCAFDPTTIFDESKIKPRSLLEVHHKNPLAEGVRYTTIADYALLCPTCHRVEHARLRMTKRS
jgi:5-methylcytosine-specific restriction protein A